jgi:hypothetical protein
MHVSHIVAVEASDYEEAIDSAESFCSAGDWSYRSFDWSDYYSVGGRWADEFGEGKDALCYADNPELFDSTVAGKIGKREEALDGYLLKARESGITLDNMKERGKGDSYANGLWALRKAVCIAEGDSRENAYFYDTSEYTESNEYLQERIKTDPSRQWIVVVDFHF